MIKLRLERLELVAAKRFNINVSDALFNDAENSAIEEGVNLSTVVRRWVRIGQYICKCQANGQKVLLENPDGTLREFFIAE